MLKGGNQYSHFLKFITFCFHCVLSPFCQCYKLYETVLYFISREHLSEEDLRKNKAMLESLTKGQLVDNPEVI